MDRIDQMRAKWASHIDRPEDRQPQPKLLTDFAELLDIAEAQRDLLIQIRDFAQTRVDRDEHDKDVMQFVLNISTRAGKP